MYSVSNRFKEAYIAQTRSPLLRAGISGTVNGNTDTYTLTGQDLVSVKVDYPFTTDDLPVCGQVFSATIEMKVRSTQVPASFWKDATDIQVGARLVLISTTPPLLEECPLGLFTVVSRKSSDNFQTYTIVGQDFASRLDVPLPTTWKDNADALWPPNTYYADTIVNNILTACNLTLDPNYTIPTDSQGNRLLLDGDRLNSIDPNATARAVIGMICGIWGGNGMMNRDGEFTFKTYEAIPANYRDHITLSMQHLGGLVRDREDPQYLFRGFYLQGGVIPNPTGFTPTDFDGGIYLLGDPLIDDRFSLYTYAKDTFMYYSDAFKTAFYDGQNYIVGGNLEYRGMPWLECGDVVPIAYEYGGTTYVDNFAIMEHSLTITGGLSGKMRCITPLIKEVDDKLGASGTFEAACVAAMDGSVIGKYRVGDVIITSTNTNPGQSLGGTWTLIDKEFTPTTATAISVGTGASNDFVLNSTNTTSMSAWVSRHGHSITLSVNAITFKVSVTGTNLTLGTFNLSNLGASEATVSPIIMGWSDGSHAIVGMNINRTSGVMQSQDVVVRGTGTSIAAGSSAVFTVELPCDYQYMTDSLCNKFYWKRTA